MIRYFYLITLLYCIEWTFSYNYIENSLGSSSHKIWRHPKKLRKGRSKNGNALVRQEFVYDKSPVEFDVASFIQPDEDSIEDDEAYRHRSKKRQNMLGNLDFSNKIGLNADEDTKMKETSLDYLNDQESNVPHFDDVLLPHDDHLKNKNLDLELLDKTNRKYHTEKYLNILNNDALTSNLEQHYPEKKCALKNIKFPFFSHNKTKSARSKKKRKLFCFNCSKKKKNEKEPVLQYKFKRSYVERLCPACKKRYTVADLTSANRIKKTPIKAMGNKKSYKKYPKLKMKSPIIQTNPNDIDRKKREESITEKYMRILDDVQRKIDNVPVNVSKFNKNTN